jgi:hypothetical protein
VAQLGARFHGMEEVVGSNPTRSTKSHNYLGGRSPHNSAICVVTSVVTRGFFVLSAKSSIAVCLAFILTSELPVIQSELAASQRPGKVNRTSECRTRRRLLSLAIR